MFVSLQGTGQRSDCSGHFLNWPQRGSIRKTHDLGQVSVVLLRETSGQASASAWAFPFCLQTPQLWRSPCSPVCNSEVLFRKEEPQKMGASPGEALQSNQCHCSHPLLLFLTLTFWNLSIYSVNQSAELVQGETCLERTLVSLATGKEIGVFIF